MSNPTTNTTTDTTVVVLPINQIVNLYFFSLMTTGLTFRGLIKVYRKKSTVLNPYFILPLTTVVATLTYIFLDINRYLVQYDDSTLTMIFATQFVMDWFATVPIDLAYFLRLRVLLVADSKFSLTKITPAASFGFLIIPVSWIVVDVIGILSVYNPEDYAVKAAYVFGVWNVGLAINEIIMHGFFVYYIITHIKSAREMDKDIIFLILLSVMVSVNSLVLLSGGIVSIFNQQLGPTIAYASWLVNVWVFLALNEAVSGNLNKTSLTGPNSARNFQSS